MFRKGDRVILARLHKGINDLCIGREWFGTEFVYEPPQFITNKNKMFCIELDMLDPVEISPFHQSVQTWIRDNLA